MSAQRFIQMLRIGDKSGDFPYGYGYCQCGCGTKMVTFHDGTPSRFVEGHNLNRETLEDPCGATVLEASSFAPSANADQTGLPPGALEPTPDEGMVLSPGNVPSQIPAQSDAHPKGFRSRPRRMRRIDAETETNPPPKTGGYWPNLDGVYAKYAEEVDRAKGLEIEIGRLRAEVEFAIAFVERCWEGNSLSKATLLNRLRDALADVHSLSGKSSAARRR